MVWAVSHANCGSLTPHSSVLLLQLSQWFGQVVLSSPAEWVCFGIMTAAITQLLLLCVASDTALQTSGKAGSPSGLRENLSNKGLGFKPRVGRHPPCWWSFEQDTELPPALGSVFFKWPWPLTSLWKRAREKRVLMKKMWCEKDFFSWFVILCRVWLLKYSVLEKFDTNF